MIRRNEYLGRMAKLREKRLVKLLSGIRGCGKTTLLAQYIDWLKRSGVDDPQIIFVSMEDPENESLLHYQGLYSHIKKQLCADRVTYVFIDEIQKCTDVEKAITGLMVKKQVVDLYATTSGTCSFSIIPYMEIRILPLSFAEYLLFSKINIPSRVDALKTIAVPGQNTSANAKIDRRLPRQKVQMEKFLQREAFNNYVSFGGFPFSTALGSETDLVRHCVDGIFNTVLVRDISRKAGINDISLLEDIAKTMSNFIGRPLSSTKVNAVIKRKISSNTVETYMRALCSAQTFYHIGRFDIKQGKHLKTLGKYYIADMGIRNLLLESSAHGRPDLDSQLENIVCMELLRKGFQVCIGKFGRDEINFVALRYPQIVHHPQMARHLVMAGNNASKNNNNEILAYIQVTATIRDKSIYTSKLLPLERIQDNCPKWILSLDETFYKNKNGIVHQNLIDWLVKTKQ
jgi:predicted AAA+ superfamily ATPase